jgi:hypothetical protein
MIMDDENTQSQPVEPTTPVEPDYVKVYTSGLLLPQDKPTTPGPHYGDDYIGIPPPPPKRRRVSPVLIAACLAIAVLLFLSAGLFYLARSFAVNQEKPTPIVRFVPITATTQPTMLPTRTPTRTPTSQPQPYPDAHTIINDMDTSGLFVKDPQYELPMQNYYSIISPGLYSDVISQPFVDSVIWDTQYWMDCSPCMGLWIYSSHSIAAEVYQNLVREGLQAENSASAGRYKFPNPEVYGRCVVDGGDMAYIAIVEKYCT